MSLLALVVEEADRVQPEASTETAAPAPALDRFLRGIERRALRVAELSTGDREDALELVQEAMLGFVRRYADKPEAEWSPLFFRVLDSRILDFHRRSQVRRRWRVWLGRDDDDGEALARVPDPREPGPWQRVADGETRVALEAALAALPLRQRQAFLLRVWEGLDVAQTACAMRCGEGSVKTHLSRALAALRARLEHWR
jgi:RNA polymerase sigma-70 factor (ECF subfamily)